MRPPRADHNLACGRAVTRVVRLEASKARAAAASATSCGEAPCAVSAAVSAAAMSDGLPSDAGSSELEVWDARRASHTSVTAAIATPIIASSRTRSWMSNRLAQGMEERLAQRREGEDVRTRVLAERRRERWCGGERGRLVWRDRGRSRSPRAAIRVDIRAAGQRGLSACARSGGRCDEGLAAGRSAWHIAMEDPELLHSEEFAPSHRLARGPPWRVAHPMD